MRNTLEIGEELIKKLEQCPQCGEPRLKHRYSDSIMCENCGLKLRVRTYKEWFADLSKSLAFIGIATAFLIGLHLRTLLH